METSALDRPIAPNEASVIRWLLDNAAVGDVTAYRIHAIEELHVRQGCECGCTSLDFQPGAWGGATRIADALAVCSDGQRAGLILWARDGNIALLEVYDCHPNASHRFPEISDLRTGGGQ
jgi:hypothetical protein